MIYSESVTLPSSTRRPALLYEPHCFLVLHPPGLQTFPSHAPPQVQRGGWELSAEREKGIFQETLKQLLVNTLGKAMPVKTTVPKLLHHIVSKEQLTSSILAPRRESTLGMTSYFSYTQCDRPSRQQPKSAFTGQLGKEGLVHTAQPGEGPGVDLVCPYEPCDLGQGLNVSVEGKCLNRV